MAEQQPDALRTAARIESAELAKAALAIAGFKVARREYGAARNVSGIRGGSFTFSRRLDSRTVFAADSRYGALARAGAWVGADRIALARCRKLTRAAGVPAAEIAGLSIVCEFGAVARRISDDEFEQREPQLLRKLVSATRAVDGVAVWSSYVRLGLTASGDVGSLELHWPHLSPSIVKEAGVLAVLVKRGFEAPKLAGARVESLAAGVIHSPAIGFHMDAAAGVRAIYVADDPTIGRKPTLFLDRHGEPVAMPRDIAPMQLEQREPRPRTKEQPGTR